MAARRVATRRVTAETRRSRLDQMALPIAIDWHDGTIVGLNTGCSKGPPDVIHGCWVDPAYFYP